MISNYGRVKNKRTGKSLKPVKMKNGYLTVNLYDKNGFSPVLISQYRNYILYKHAN